MKLGRVGVAVNQRKLLDGEPPFFIFALHDAIVYDQGIAQVEFRGPSTLRTGRAICGPRAWIEADYDSLEIRRQDT